MKIIRTQSTDSHLVTIDKYLHNQYVQSSGAK